MPGRQNTARAERLQWVLGYVSGAAVLAIAGYLLWQGFADPPAASLSIEAGPVGPEGQLRFTVSNDGGRTATDVAVSLTLRKGNDFFDEQRLVIDYVPGHSDAMEPFCFRQATGRSVAPLWWKAIWSPDFAHGASHRRATAFRRLDASLEARREDASNATPFHCAVLSLLPCCRGARSCRLRLAWSRSASGAAVLPRPKGTVARVALPVLLSSWPIRAE